MADSSTPVIDRDRLVSNMDGDLDLLRDMLGMFNQSAPQLMAQLKEAAARGDAGTLERVAHRFKGTLASFFAARAVPIVSELEMKGRRKELTGSVEMVAALEKEVALVPDALQKIVDGLPL